MLQIKLYDVDEWTSSTGNYPKQILAGLYSAKQLMIAYLKIDYDVSSKNRL